MFYPDYFMPLAEPWYRAQSLKQDVAQRWAIARPYLTNSVIATLKIVVTAAAGAYFMGVWSGRFSRRLSASARAAIESGRDAWIMYEKPVYTLHDPADYFGSEYLPHAETFAEFVKLCEGEPSTADPNEPIQLPAPNAPDCEDPFGMDDFDPIPLTGEDWEAAELDELPTVPDLNQTSLTPEQFDALADMGADVAAGLLTEEEAIAIVEVTPQYVQQTRKRRGRPRKAQADE